MFNKIQALLRLKGYHIFSRPYELNIVGLRNKSTIPNRFDDEMHVFYRTSAFNWDYHVFKVTTDPGTFWLKNPMSPQGTAILPEGQFLSAYGLGLHKGQYKALVEIRPVTVIRDYDRDAVLDFYNGKKETGQFGINIHRANKVGTTLTVDRNSAGCQVFENADDFDVFLELCENHKKLFGNVFTYTLLDFRTVQRRNRRIALLSTAAIATLGFMGHHYYQNETKEQYAYA